MRCITSSVTTRAGLPAGPRTGIPLLLLLSLLISPPGSAGARETGEKILSIGTKEAPPFAIENPDGTWGGLSIDLWNRVAHKLGVESRYVETDLEGLFQGIRDGDFDASVAAITVTAEREAEFDFTHPIYTTGLGIAARSTGGGWMHVLRQFFSISFFRAIIALLGVLLLVGFVAWLFERRHNPDQFGKAPLHGVGAGFWWAAVTMTTVGYGDKAPSTLGGRIVGLVWMFTAVIIISGFTAAITTALTVSRLDTLVDGPDDLYQVRVAGVSGSTSEDYLERNRISYRAVPTLDVALRALADDDVDAVVYDAPLLKYQLKLRQEGRLTVLPYIFDRQDYAILLPAGSDLREPINRILLDEMQTQWWEETVEKYLGR